MGVGALSMLVPMYNAELAPPGIRGSLVALQQLAITFGILVSYWIAYGTNCAYQVSRHVTGVSSPTDQISVEQASIADRQ